MLLSHDLFRTSHAYAYAYGGVGFAYGGVGFTYLLDEVPSLLKERGIDDGMVTAMLTSNPQRALAGFP